MNRFNYAASKANPELPEVYVGQQWKWRQDPATLIQVVGGNAKDGWEIKRIDKDAWRPKKIFRNTTGQLVRSYEPL